MTANLLLDNELPAPRCYNREPVERVRTRYGIDQDTGEIRAFEVDDGWSSPGCKTWSGEGIGKPTPEYPSGDPYPLAHGWVSWCRSCRWRPAGVRL